MTETQEQLDTTTNKLSDLNKKVQALFDSKDQNYLSRDVTDEQVKDLQEQVSSTIQSISKDTLSDNKTLAKVSFDGYDKVKNDVEDQLEKAEKMIATQSAVNLFFKHDEKTQALNGTDVKKDLPITDNLKKETIETAKKDVETKDEPTSFEQTVSDLLKNAEDQINQISKAKTEVAKVFKDGKVTSTDKKAYDTAKAETDKIKNAKAKKELSDQLSKVKADIDKKEKAEAEKKADTSNAETKAEGNNVTADATQAQANEQTTNGATTGGATASNQESSYNDAGTGGYADNGYTPSYDTGNQGTGGGSTGGGYTPPASNGSTGSGSSSGGSQGGSASTGGGQTAGGNDNVITVKPEDIQGSEDNNYGGSNEWWGW